MMNLRCGTTAQRALAYLWAPCGAFIVDEAPQGAAALYHAVALRSCYGRVAAHEVELSDYAEPSQTFGIPSPSDWMRYVITKWIYPYPYPVVITSLVADQVDTDPNL